MPQMSPLSWLTLFVYFLIIFITINSFNYFLVKLNLTSNMKEQTKSLLNWKW